MNDAPDHSKFKVGEVVVCRAPLGYDLTEGKQYTLVDYQAEYYDSDCPAGFTWPAYVGVVDDCGKYAHCPANRFIYPENKE